MSQVLMIEDKLTKFLESIRVPEQFGSWEDGDGAEAYSDKFFEYNIEWYCGASKCVYVIPGCNKVVKIPYEGNWFTYEENDDYIDAFEEFYNAGCRGTYDSSWNYCNTEAEMYDILVENHLDEFFCETKFWGYSKDGHPLYIQDRAREYDYRSDSQRVSEPSSKKAREINKVRRLSDDWVALAIDWYGEIKVKELLDFLDNNKYYIGEDLHDGNIGFLASGQPVIFDYSGFCE